MPAISAASMIRVPLGTVTVTPSIVQVIMSAACGAGAAAAAGAAPAAVTAGADDAPPDGALPGEIGPRFSPVEGPTLPLPSFGSAIRLPLCPGHGARGTGAVADMLEILVPEFLDRADDRRGAGVAQHADRRAGHVRGQVEQYVDVLFGALPRLDPPHDLGDPLRAFAARSALPARLMGVELDHAPHLLHHAGPVVHDDDGRGAQHGPGGDDALVIEVDV